MTDGCGHQFGLMDGSAASVSDCLLGPARSESVGWTRFCGNHYQVFLPLSIYTLDLFPIRLLAVHWDHLPVFFFILCGVPSPSLSLYEGGPKHNITGCVEPERD